MPKKHRAKLEQQVTFRVTAVIYDRIEEAARKLGLAGSELLRMMLAEKLPEYEARAKLAEGPHPQGQRPGTR